MSWRSRWASGIGRAESRAPGKTSPRRPASARRRRAAERCLQPSFGSPIEPWHPTRSCGLRLPRGGAAARTPASIISPGGDLERCTPPGLFRAVGQRNDLRPASLKVRAPMLMHQLLLDGAIRQPGKTALCWVDRDTGLTFAEAVSAMERFAGALHHLGVRKGDRVSIFAHNGMDYLIALFACWRIGAIAALVNVRFADELDYYFADHEPSIVIYTHDMLDAVKRAAAHVRTIRALVCMDGPQPGVESLPALLQANLPPPPDPGDDHAIAPLPYTPATPGRPKGACLAHEPTMRAANCIAERLRITDDDVSFGPTALSSSYQLVGNLLPPLHRGATVNVMTRWTQVQGWDALER